MSLYRIRVVETVEVEVTYHVEADTADEAKELATNGETESETDRVTKGVQDRQVLSLLD